MTLIFDDLLNPELDRFIIVSPWTTYANLQQRRIVRFQMTLSLFTSLTDERTNERPL